MPESVTACICRTPLEVSLAGGRVINHGGFRFICSPFQLAVGYSLRENREHRAIHGWVRLKAPESGNRCKSLRDNFHSLMAEME
ncbi:hypothetical protein CDAR_8221 [Caerostris darwini]|uniref:Uncharacterized protein n=1 Tax=Caerostris darwini TaxID=1538125 RepID=A0AAV4MM60_9ARAC|nr:hypothetical protein CDAR_8221 [Caerostris darwini]